jgi:hypothetical protein
VGSSVGGVLSRSLADLAALGRVLVGILLADLAALGRVLVGMLLVGLPTLGGIVVRAFSEWCGRVLAGTLADAPALRWIFAE